MSEWAHDSGQSDSVHAYIHVPFCRARCDYCDFFTRTSVAAERMHAVVARTCRELLDEFDSRTTIADDSTIYIGGGTPSVLAGRARSVLLNAISTISDRHLSPQSEVTIEINPEDVTYEYLDELHDVGVNRVSVGVQSLNHTMLAGVGRHTSREATLRGLDAIAKRWRGRWSVDVLVGLPGQTRAQAEHDLLEVLAFGPRHVSLYELTVVEGTVLASRLERTSRAFSNSSRRSEVVLHAMALLRERGYRWYEISNFALDNEIAVHNSAYWRGRPYVGFGPSAVSTRTVDQGRRRVRTVQAKNFALFLSDDHRRVQVESLGPREVAIERLMVGLRTDWGVPQAYASLIPRTLERWQGEAFFRHGALILSDRGRLLLNSFLVDAFAELDDLDHIPIALTRP